MSEASIDDAVSVKFDGMVQEGKNKTKICCQRCSSVILLPQKASMKEKELFLPHMKKKPNAAPKDGETLNKFWLVDDMFTFENLGFTNTVDNIKYLICADCEVGPIGVHDIRQNKQFYIALDRVRHEDY
ncbi:guanine nucleotide exchange factor MSS4-like [Ylistrum balloti]|uniref:guanine nucleotide exchange factor MSS4-like n=1 Tax=Ylistrum balloti TaxID=509963 RepID=UPI002905C928|nr:guanine nucleotide exchange factor MSS4-like [Ylistrum balloti]